jgi:hypothetical protein
VDLSCSCSPPERRDSGSASASAITRLRWSLQMLATPKGLSDEKATRMMAALRDGQTLRLFCVTAPRLDAYFAIHPEYAREARPLIEANAKAALLRKGARLRNLTHCINGHTLADARVYYQHGYIKRDCRTCWKIRSQRGGVMKPEALIKVKAALTRGATIGLIIHGRPVGGGKPDPSLRIVDAGILSRYRRENPGFNRFVLDAIEKRIGMSNPVLAVAAGTFKYEWDPADRQFIWAMLPEHFPDKDVVINDMIVSLLEGRLDRSQIGDKIHQYIRAQNRLFPTKYAKFGNSRLVSLDEVMFEDGTMTRGDTISRGLWD